MAGFKKFQEIVAWQLSHELKLRVDAFIVRPAFKRKYKFVDQLSDAVRSAPRNIAEGHMRGFKHKEFAQLVRTARGLIRYLESTPDPPPPRYRRKPPGT